MHGRAQVMHGRASHWHAQFALPAASMVVLHIDARPCYATGCELTLEIEATLAPSPRFATIAMLIDYYGFKNTSFLATLARSIENNKGVNNPHS